jgi:hypothetical protein
MRSGIFLRGKAASHSAWLHCQRHGGLQCACSAPCAATPSHASRMALIIRRQEDAQHRCPVFLSEQGRAPALLASNAFVYIQRASTHAEWHAERHPVRGWNAMRRWHPGRGCAAATLGFCCSPSGAEDMLYTKAMT